MFTWECPSCGKELDIDARRCPQCGADFGEPEEAESVIPAAKPAPVSQVPAAPPPPAPVQAAPSPAPSQPSATPRPAATLPEPHRAASVTAAPSSPPIQERSAPPPPASGIQPKHLAVVLVVLLVAVTAAVYFARPDLFQKRQDLALEDVPVSDAVGFASAAFGDLQIAGVRPVYGDDMKAKVRYVVINHGETPQSNVNIQAHLSPKDAPLDAPPLASFTVAFDEELTPGASREIETDLMALGTLAAFPPWKDIRIDLEVE